jgi:hypothetical protein
LALTTSRDKTAAKVGNFLEPKLFQGGAVWRLLLLLFIHFGLNSRKILFFFFYFFRVYSAAHWAALTSTIPSSGLAWWRRWAGSASAVSEASHSGPLGAAATITTTSAASRVSDGTRPFSVENISKFKLNLIQFS